MNRDFVNEPQSEAQRDILAEQCANVERWLFALGLNAQLYQFNQELIRVALRSNGDAKDLFPMVQRWRNFLAPYMAQHEAKCKAAAQVVHVDHLADIEVLIHG